MFPEHCKDVSVKRVSFPLKEKDIKDNLKNKTAYKKTEFIVLKNGDEWAVVRIIKSPSAELFNSIEEVQIVSLPSTTTYHEDSSVDVLSPTKMAEKAEKLGAKTLIVKGKFEHVSFIHEEEPVPLLVFEVTPPKPPKLLELVKKVLYSGAVSKPVKIVPQTMDLRKIERQCNNPKTVFACQASGLKSEKESFYLDQRPEFTQEEAGSVFLIGCTLSHRIFKTIYGVEPAFFNFCPKQRALDSHPEQLIITKCCEIKCGYERIGKVAVVPWGATEKEVEEALCDLLAGTGSNEARDG